MGANGSSSADGTTSSPQVDGNTVVLDTGSGVTKVGFGGAMKPAAMFPSVVGLDLIGSDSASRNSRSDGEVTLGAAAASLHNVNPNATHLLYPVERGLILHWMKCSCYGSMHSTSTWQ